MQQEPIVLTGVVKLALLLAASFGFDLTAEQILYVVGIVELVAVAIQRQSVFAPATVADLTLSGDDALSEDDVHSELG